MGIAVRMATLMNLHKEETYVLLNPTMEEIVEAESARRTLVSPFVLPLHPALAHHSIVDAA